MFVLYKKIYRASEFSRRFKEKLEKQLRIKLRISAMDTDEECRLLGYGAV
jgi:hypothetical protein